MGITSQDQLQTVETEKKHKYDLLAGELGMLHKCTVEIIPYVMTWDGIVTKYHKKYVHKLGIQPNVEAYMQSRVIKRTLESVSFEARRGILDGPEGNGEVDAAVEKLLGAIEAQASA